MADERTVVKVQGARVSYPYVYKARGAKPGKEGRFECSFLLDPSNAEHTKKILELKTEAAKVAKEKWGDKVDLKKLKLCFSVNPEDATYCPDFFVLQTWNKERPLVVNRSNVPTVSESDVGAVFAGAWVNTNTTFFAWEFKDPDTGMLKKGVSANLRSIQYVSGDPTKDRFGGQGRVNAEDEFEAIGDATNDADGSVVDPFA